MDLGIAGETALVIGGGKGIGLGIYRALAAAGVQVIITSRKAEDAERAAADIAASCIGLPCDTSSQSSIADLLDNLQARSANIGIVVLNSGGPPAGLATNANMDAYRDAFEQLFIGPVTIAMRLLASMRARKFGRILTVGSSGMVEPIPNLAVSNAIRPTIAGWSKTLSREVAMDGVTVNVLIPGRIDTDRVAQIDANNAKIFGLSVKDVRMRSQAQIPLGRYGMVEEFAAAAAFLASRQASFITGTSLRVDGGQLVST